MFQLEIIKQIVAGVIRWGLAIIGVRLVEQGLRTTEQVEDRTEIWVPILTGVVILLGVLAWKWLNARYHFFSMQKAVQTTPPADTPEEITKAMNQVRTEVEAEHAVAAV